MPSSPKTFRNRNQPSRQEQRKQYDERRGSASERGYTHRWSKAAATFKTRYPLCLGCEAAGLVVASQLVDHVEPHRGDQDKFWDTSMWQACCGWHHDVVKQRLEQMWDRGEVQVVDLWLNSPIALAVASRLRGD